VIAGIMGTPRVTYRGADDPGRRTGLSLMLSERETVRPSIATVADESEERIGAKRPIRDRRPTAGRDQV